MSFWAWRNSYLDYFNAFLTPYIFVPEVKYLTLSAQVRALQRCKWSHEVEDFATTEPVDVRRQLQKPGAAGQLWVGKEIENAAPLLEALIPRAHDLYWKPMGKETWEIPAYLARLLIPVDSFNHLWKIGSPQKGCFIRVWC